MTFLLKSYQRVIEMHTRPALRSCRIDPPLHDPTPLPGQEAAPGVPPIVTSSRTGNTSLTRLNPKFYKYKEKATRLLS